MRQHDRLDELAAAIRGLRVAVVDRDREARESFATEEDAERATYRFEATKMRLEAVKDIYIAESERMRSRACPTHIPGVVIAGCIDCLTAADLRGGPPVPRELRLLGGGR